MVANGQSQKDVKLFIAGLDSIRKALKIPAMSVAVKTGNIMRYENGMGYADLEKKIPATSKTVFRVTSVTKTFTSTLVMKLVEDNKLQLDTPVIRYGVDLGNDKITIKNLITHTSEGIPGNTFQYNGYRYGRLGQVLERVTGLPFEELLMDNILISARMTSSAPAISIDKYNQFLQRRPSIKAYFDTVFNHLAKPYAINSEGKVIPTQYLNEFGAFGGLATTAGDLIKYSEAIDQHQFIRAKTQALVFTANLTNRGTKTPYGLGWFVQNYQGINYYWHYGQTQGESALFIKVPQLKITLAVLCNSDKLSQPFPLGDGDLFTSPVAELFYRCFIARGRKPDRLFKNKEMVAQATMALFNRDTTKALHIYQRYAGENITSPIPKGVFIAAISKVGINADSVKQFTLVTPAKIRVFGVGENCSPDLKYWCDYGWIEDYSGKIIWNMQGQPASSAGGAAKNQKVDQVISLPAGKYKLRFKSDSGHAFNSWDSLPPDNFFWGILLFKVAVN
ncbi:hypothetical protein TH53_22700 [Pedobacter lusitanus]|uniref:Beta-lactamase-related domain-containing protein n=1 Tax=Pedobacter lusitanus TaxID=1503925 RepID=A0A0D0FRG7_9SPHI|nr:hypothetical protein TH53_22700 [Pedobacter lusitanus]